MRNFPPPFPARANACAGAVTGRHSSPRRPTIYKPAKQNSVQSGSRAEAAQQVALTTIFSSITMFAMIFIFKSMGVF